MHILQRIVAVLIVALGLSVLTLAVVLFTASPAPAAPTITWTPAQVAETVGQGTQKTKVVSFTSTQNLNNVSVWIVPELQSYVSVSPSSFSAISAGAMIDLTLTFSAPVDASLQTFDGTLHLRDNSGKSPKTYAQPLPTTISITDPTASWRAFTDPTGHYSVNLPPDLEVEFITAETLLVVRRPSSQGSTEEPALFFSIDPNPDGLIIQEYYDGNPGLNLIGQSAGQYSLITIGGHPGFKFVPFVTLAGDVVVVVPSGGIFIRITDHGASFQINNIFDLILRTLQL